MGSGAHKPADSGAGVGSGARICRLSGVTLDVFKRMRCEVFIALQRSRICLSDFGAATDAFASKHRSHTGSSVDTDFVYDIEPLWGLAREEVRTVSPDASAETPPAASPADA